MGFKLVEVKDDSEFPPIWLAFREAFADPGNGMWALFMGDWQPEDAEAREAALHESCARLIAWHRGDPTSTWLKVVDDETGEIAAGGRWSIYQSGNPYDGHEHMDATWFPAGEPRAVATKLLNDFLVTACRNVNRPHAFLNILFTAPKYRRKGAASMIMDWGFEKAKAQGLEVYLEATKEGKPLYEKYGLKAIDSTTLQIDEQVSQPGGDAEARKKAIDAMTPFTWWSMIGSPK